jgi:hypothetical protein
MWAIFLRRGPWGYVQATWPEREQDHAQIDSLGELAGLLGLGPAFSLSVMRGRGSSAWAQRKGMGYAEDVIGRLAAPEQLDGFRGEGERVPGGCERLAENASASRVCAKAS